MNARGIGEVRDQSGQHEPPDKTGTTQGFLERLLLPIATEADAAATCTAVRPYIDPPDTRLIAVHVIEKTPGYPDKMPLEAARERATAIFDVVHDRFADEDFRVSTELRYGPSIVEEIFTTSDAVDATAIGFTPRPGRRWTRILTGDVAYRLVSTSPQPVVVFPRPSKNSR